MQRTILISLLLTLAPACATLESTGSGMSDAHVAQSQFERIKSLAGEWTGPGPAEMGGAPMEVHYRVTSGGNAVEETIMPGSEHEMVSMYHLDGNQVMMTHYCAVGNQPRMVAVHDSSAGGNISTIRFEYAGATNLASPQAGHMHQMEMTIDGKDHLTTHWTYFEGGKASHDATFDLKRK
ncbi:MAG TPA: hypothetical protein VGR31_03810 [Planctomycetota bacterium]|jgi:hypothetical protein|nr:hypothetical protein [Planctomycetota bacterium]